jgi:hypothetical protein
MLSVADAVVEHLKITLAFTTHYCVFRKQSIKQSHEISPSFLESFANLEVYSGKKKHVFIACVVGSAKQRATTSPLEEIFRRNAKLPSWSFQVLPVLKNFSFLSKVEENSINFHSSKPIFLAKKYFCTESGVENEKN